MEASQPSERNRVLIVSASMGAGHDGVAAELARRGAELGLTVDRCDFLTLLPFRIGSLLRVLYRWQLKAAPRSWGWLLSRLEHQPSLHLVSHVFSWLARRRLRAEVGTNTGLVVSTYPLASQALGTLRSRQLIDCRVATFLTDMSVHPLWVSDGVDLHLSLHEVPARQARSLGAADVRVVGPAVSPSFRPGCPEERTFARSVFALPDTVPLALVVAGSWGVGDITHAVRDVATTGLALPIVVCGQNAALQRSLLALGIISFAWVSDMPTLMRACDVLVQNAGGLTSLQGRASGLPVVTYRPLDGHGTTNASALEEAGWTWWARSRDELTSVLTAALALSPEAAPQEWPVPAAVEPPDLVVSA